jgi:hypothetical protein
VACLIVCCIFLLINIKGKAQENPDTILIVKENIVFDTIMVNDTILLIDTISIESSGPYKSIAIYGGLNRQINRYSKFVTDEIKQINNSSFTNKSSYSTGIDFRLDWKKWSVSTGVSYSDFSSDFKYSYSTEMLDSTYFEDYDTTEYWIVDTVDIYYQLVEQDTITFYVTDSSKYLQIDSISGYNTETINVDTNYKSVEHIRMIEFPLIVSRPVISSEKYFVSLQLGVIAGFMIKQETYFIPKTGVVVDVNQTVKFIPSVWIGLNYEYYIGETLSLEAELYYKPSLLPSLTYNSKAFLFTDTFGGRVKLRWYF